MGSDVKEVVKALGISIVAVEEHCVHMFLVDERTVTACLGGVGSVESQRRRMLKWRRTTRPEKDACEITLRRKKKRKKSKNQRKNLAAIESEI